MKQYNLETVQGLEEDEMELVESASGEYVKVEDVKTLLKDLRQFVRLTFGSSPGVLDIEEWSKKEELKLK